MYDVAERYGEEFVTNMFNTKPIWRKKSYDAAARIIKDRLRPETVLEVGAGCGYILKGLQDRGVSVTGTEGSEWYRPRLAEIIGAENVVIQDLRVPFDLGKFDLVMSFEVLEHLEEEFAEVAVDNITRHANRCLITACPRGDGYWHINYKPMEYWQDLFSKKGYYMSTKQAVWFKRCGVPWLKNRLMYFRRGHV